MNTVSRESKKCFFCKKKTIIILECSHCKSNFCIKHCSPEYHNCKHEITKSFKLPDKPIISKVEVI